MACFQVSPNKLLTAAAMLKTREANQKQLTASAKGVPRMLNENCNVVAVTAEKKVATVERLSLRDCCKQGPGTMVTLTGKCQYVKEGKRSSLTRLSVLCFCPNRMVGIPTRDES